MAGNDSYTKSLLHMNGVDNGTSFPDDAVGGTHIWTPSGGVVTKTAIKKFGSASGYFPQGAVDHLETPDSDDWALLTEDFTIDEWIYVTDTATAYDAPIWEQYQNGSNWNTWHLVSNYYFYLISYYASAVNLNLNWYPVSMTKNVWHHIAVVRSGTNFRLFIDGVSQGTKTDAGSIANIGGTLRKGHNRQYGYRLKGYEDEWRWSKGIARWWDNFTPPTEEYSPVAVGSAFIF